MSFNQSKSDKNDTAVYRKSGRSASFNQQRGSSGGAYVKGGGGSSGVAAPSPSQSLPSSRSFNKKSNNAQGGQSRVNPTQVNSTESNSTYAVRTTPNGTGTNIQPQFHGGSNAPVTNATAKSPEASVVQRSPRVVPKAPTSQHPAMSSNPAAPATPAKAPGDASKAFAFQFGSISPSFVNGMAIPARTSSAPPNLDEQKRDQARHDSFRPVPSGPTPPVPKQQPMKKDTGVTDQSNTGETRTGSVTDQSNAGETRTGTKAKKDTPVSTPPPVSQMQKPSVVPLTGISMPMPYHQSQVAVSVQFGGPNPQIQSQGMPTASLQMPLPMTLPIGNAAQVQQQVFVPGLQSHHMHPQGIMHQGQSMSFTPQMGPQLSHQLGNMGIGIGPQYPPQQGGKFAAPRKTTTVKITHPETHEELRLDKRADAYSDVGSSGARSHSNVPSQSQSVPPFTASRPVNYYPPSSYTTGSLFYPPPSSLSLTSSQITPNSQPPRFNYAVNHGPQNVSFMNSSHGSLPVNRVGISIPGIVEPPNPELSHDVHNTISLASPGVTSVSTKSNGGCGAEDSSFVDSSISGAPKSESPSFSVASGDASSSVPRKVSETCSEISSQESKQSSDSSVLSSLPKLSDASVAASAEKLTAAPSMPSSSSVSEDSVSVVSNNEGRRKESLSRSNSLKDNQKKLQKTGQSQHQVAEQSSGMANVPSQAVESGISDSGVSKTVESKTNNSGAITSEDLSAAASDTLSAASGSISYAVEVKTNGSTQVSACVSAKGPVTQDVFKNDELDELSEQDKLNILGMGDKTEMSSLQGCEQNISDGGIDFKQPKQGDAKVRTEVLTLKTVQKGHDESTNCSAECDKMGDDLGVSTSSVLDSRDVSLSRNDRVASNEAVPTNSCSSDQQRADISETTSKHCKDSLENADSGSLSLPASVTKDKPNLEPSMMKTTSKGKKKLREILQKADAAGSTSDLYNAYKGPEEKKVVAISEKTESASTSGSLEQLPIDAAHPDALGSQQCGQNKAELDDWEDAADISTPKLEILDKTQQVCDGNGFTAKKYSRDFLLKFAVQCTDLPEGFETTADIAEALMSGSHVIERDSHPSPGDRPGGMSRMDRLGSGVSEEDKWSKVSGASHSGMRLDGIGGNAGFRPGQGGNFGVSRNLRTQAPTQYARGVLSGPIQSMGNPGGMQRNSLDGERWQRAPSFQLRGLFPSPPPTPLQMMHKAEKKYEVGKVSDVEEAKQRQLKAILNKLTPQNFEKLFEQVKDVNIDNAVTLRGVISQIFEKALMEPTFCEMYANFCSHLAAELPDFTEDNERITFKRLLLNKCQEEFERGEREQEEANKADEGELKMTNEQREERRTKARRRMLGNIRLIGELYKKKMLTERIMHDCIQKLLGQYQQVPDEEDIEALCKLMSTIGEMIDHPKAKEHIDVYFERMGLLSNNMNLSSRVRFMLKDAIDLRKNKWQQRRKVEGPKKIEEVHRDASQERQAQAGRLGRGPGNNSARRITMDFSPRGSSMLSTANAQMGGLRGLPTQVRGYGSQDVRIDERQSYDARSLSIPLPQRPLGDDSITLGPQGGLARGMSIRGPTAVSSSTGLNGYGNLSERAPYSSREDLAPRYVPDRFAAPTAYDQSSAQERNMNYGNRDMRNVDRNLDRPVVTSPHTLVQGTTVSLNTSSEKVWPEERLRDMSMAAIREYYSARDEKEIVLCVKDLNSPSFHPSMVSLWVTDSFERKDIERDLLAQLLVNLVKSRDNTLTPSHLIKGFESVLSTLEDVVNDAPKAAEFLGRIFAKAITEHVVSLKEIGQIIYDGGEEPGRLLEVGLAADVLGSIFEVIKMEKGDAALSEIHRSSNLRLETFRPPDPITSRKLEKFI